MSAFSQLLSSHTVDEIPSKSTGIVEISSSTSPNEAFDILLKNNILSAPVWDDASKVYTGFLDMRDLVSFVVFSADQNLLVPRLQDLVNEGVKMFQSAVDGISVTYLSKRHPIHTITSGTTLEEVSRLLCKHKRVPVVNDEGKVINIVSQSSLIAFLDKHTKETTSETNQGIDALKIGSSNVQQVKTIDSALDTFRLMDKRNLSGLAVVDPSGKLIGNTSGRDLKLFVQKQETLDQPIMQFLNKIRQESIDIKSPTISVKPTETLRMVVAKLAATRIHRVFVVDADYKPISVVALSDIIRFIVSTFP